MEHHTLDVYPIPKDKTPLYITEKQMRRTRLILV